MTSLIDPPSQGADPERVRRIVDAILSRPEYAATEPSLVDRARLWVLESLGRLLDLLFSGGRASLLGTVVLALAVLAMTVLAVRFLRGVRRDPERAAAVSEPAGRTARDWLGDAARHEDARRWRDALRCRYRALVAELAAAGLVDDVPGRTSGEYLAELSRRAPGAGPPFDGATRAFETAWYGGAPVDPGSVRMLADGARHVLEAAGVRAGAPAGGRRAA
ncbi:MAG: DUF4129 domain-containing protein [Actinobacteria bacterium]|nr:DUF4129 domain-containing protein [Actinomycetota bacterium]